MAQNQTNTFKIVLLGEGRVGKTSLCLRYCKGMFSESQESTIQATYLEKRLTLGKQSVKLMIWDTAGQERFHSLGPLYYRDAHGALLVYDITDDMSFVRVRRWVKELQQMVGENIAIVLAGNKADLKENRQVNEEDVKEYALTVKAPHVHCSAKSGAGVEQVFLELTKEMLKKKDSSSRTNSDKAQADKIIDDLAAQDKKDNGGGCC